MRKKAEKGFLRSDTGFTLIEMAIAIVIIGLIAGMGVGVMRLMVQRQKLAESKQTVKTVYNAVIGYAEAHKYLPPDLTVLGVPTKDAYLEDLKYYSAVGITGSGTNICTDQGTYLQVDDRGTIKNNVAFILFSTGENLCNQTGDPSSPSFSGFTIRDTGTLVACSGQNMEYDDEVIYMDVASLRQEICSPFQIVTRSLPEGTAGSAYPSSTLEATDGVKPYSWSSPDMPQNGLSLSSSGVVSGTPSSAGTVNFLAVVTDQEGKSASRSFSITINP